VKQLKSILMDRGDECKGCVEKDEFIKKVQETEHLGGAGEFQVDCDEIVFFLSEHLQES